MNLTVLITPQLLTRVKAQHYYLLLGNPYIFNLCPSWQGITEKYLTLPHLRECIFHKVSRNTQFSSSLRIPLQTSHTRARVSHIIRDESKSISYHAISLSFPLSLFLPAKTRTKKAICRNLHSNLHCHQEVMVHSNTRFASHSYIR